MFNTCVLRNCSYQHSCQHFEMNGIRKIFGIFDFVIHNIRVIDIWSRILLSHPTGKSFDAWIIRVEILKVQDNIWERNCLRLRLLVKKSSLRNSPAWEGRWDHVSLLPDFNFRKLHLYRPPSLVLILCEKFQCRTSFRLCRHELRTAIYYQWYPWQICHILTVFSSMFSSSNAHSLTVIHLYRPTAL